jgi:hypothetical protein
MEAKNDAVFSGFSVGPGRCRLRRRLFVAFPGSGADADGFGAGFPQ